MFLIVASVSYGQNIVVEKIRITNNNDVSEIPRVRDLKNANNAVVKKINAQILDRLNISSFEQNESEEFHWYGMKHGSEINDDMLFIWFIGEYYAAYDNYVEDCFYFSLKTGEILKMNAIPFQALFTLSGYLDFMNKYWLNGAKKEFNEAFKCGGIEPYCSYYDIKKYYIRENKLFLSLVDDCNPRAMRACSPAYGISVELSDVKEYLNDVGKYILIESDYFSKSSIDKFKENKRLNNKVPDNLYLFGKIDNKYPMSMAIYIDKENRVLGYYYYDNKLHKLNLQGEKKGEQILLTEKANGKITGSFELKINMDSKGFIMTSSNDKFEYLSGTWSDANKTKQFDITFTAAKSKGSFHSACP